MKRKTEDRDKAILLSSLLNWKDSNINDTNEDYLNHIRKKRKIKKQICTYIAGEIEWTRRRVKKWLNNHNHISTHTQTRLKKINDNDLRIIKKIKSVSGEDKQDSIIKFIFKL